MSEEIIIEDVNVAECNYHRMNNQIAMCTACNSGKGSPFCEYEKDCYYKQLQRLKQENEELKKDLKAEAEQAQKWYQRETDKHFIAIKYKQALEEIREIANQKYDCVNSEVMCCRLCERLELIMTKINEVLNG